MGFIVCFVLFFTMVSGIVKFYWCLYILLNFKFGDMRLLFATVPDTKTIHTFLGSDDKLL